MENKHETQHPFISMLKEWKNVLDKGEYISVLFMDLSKKAFNASCLPQILLGPSLNTLSHILHTYFTSL